MSARAALFAGTALQVDAGNLFSAFTDSEGGFWAADFNFIGKSLSHTIQACNGKN